MSLDERLRAELRAVETGELGEDDALDSVYRSHDRGLVRGRITRQALAVAVVVSLFASVALVVSLRNDPDRAGVAAGSDPFRSTATIRLATASGARELALAPSTIQAVSRAAHLSPDISRIDFRATLDPARHVLSLTVTAPTPHESELVTRRWSSAFLEARRDEAIRLLRAASRAVNRKANALLDRLRRVNAELVRLDPAKFKGRNLEFSGRHSFDQTDPPPPHGPEQGSVRELNLANERIQILAQLADLSAQSASTRIANLTPEVAGTVIAQTPAVRVHVSSPSRTTPVILGWAIGLLVVLGGAVVLYRRRTRSTRQVAA